MENQQFFLKPKAVNYDLSASELNFYPKLLTQAEVATMASAVADKCLNYDLILAKILPLIDPVGYRKQPHSQIMADYAAVQKWQRELSQNRLTGHHLRLAADQICGLNSKYNLAICKFMYAKFQEFKTMYYPSMQQYYEYYYAHNERVPNGALRAFMSNYRKYCHFLKNLDTESTVFAEDNPYIADTRLRREGLEDLVHIMAYDLSRLGHYQEKLAKQSRGLDRANGLIRTEDAVASKQYLVGTAPKHRKQLLESLATMHANLDERFYQSTTTEAEVDSIEHKMQARQQTLPPIIERKQFLSETLPIKQHWWSCLFPKKNYRHRTRVEVVTEPLANNYATNASNSSHRSLWHRFSNKIIPERKVIDRKIVTSDTVLSGSTGQRQILKHLLKHCKAENAFWGLDNYETESLARLAKPTVDFLYRQYRKMLVGDSSAANTARVQAKIRELQNLFPNKSMDRSSSPVNLRNFVNSVNAMFSNLHLTEAEFREYKQLLHYKALQAPAPLLPAVTTTNLEVPPALQPMRQASSPRIVQLASSPISCCSTPCLTRNSSRRHLRPIAEIKLPSYRISAGGGIRV